MNILFLTISRVNEINDRGIYTDLIRKFRNEGHNVYVISPVERRFKQKTELIQDNGVYLLKIKTLNIQKTNVIEKGIASLFLEYQFSKKVNYYFSGVKFYLIISSTPPITFTKTIRPIKKRDNAKSYLLLKDIFPQNAVDLRILKNAGLLHRFNQQCYGCL